MLSIHVELHYSLEEILSLLGGCYLTHGAVQELFLVLDYKLVALDDGGADIEGPKLGSYISDLEGINLMLVQRYLTKTYQSN